MPFPQATFQRIDDMMASGETVDAFNLMREALRKHDPENRAAMQKVITLSGRYHNWEADKRNLHKEDKTEIASIRREAMLLLNYLQNPSDHASPFSVPITTSPDPLRPIYIQQTPSHPQPPAKSGSPVSKIVTWVFVVMGILFLLGLVSYLLEPTPDPEPRQETNSIVAQPELETDAGTAPPPVRKENTNTQPAAPAPEPQVQPEPQTFEPKVSQSISSGVLNKLQSIVNSGRELQVNELLELNDAEVAKQLANSRWYQQNLGTVIFDEYGETASYLAGNGYFEIEYSTIHGFYVGSYEESATGDAGFVALVPPNNNRSMTIYVESNLYGTTNYLELTRQ